MTKLTLSVEETSQLLGLSINSTYEAIRTGRIPSVRIGRRLLVPRLALDSMLESASAPQLESEARKCS